MIETATKNLNKQQTQDIPRDGESKAHKTVVIAPPTGWSALNLRELFEYRDLLYFMVMRDIKTRYRQTALGPLWIIINPLFSMVIYTVVFGMIARLPSGNSPYAVFTYTALLPWDFFADAVNSGTSSLFQNRHILGKVYFPRLLLPISRIFSSLLDFAIQLTILFGMMVWFGIRPTWGLAFIPLFLLIGAMSGLGFGLWFSGIIVKYRDFGNITGYLTRVWMYATPVVYSKELIPEQWRTVYLLNPMANVIDGFRWALLGEAQPDWIMMGVSSLLMFVIFVGGLYTFRRVERSIVDIA